MILQHPKTKTRNMRREAIWKNQNLTNQNLVILKKRWCEPPPNGGCQKFSFQNRFHKQEHVVIPDFVFIIQIVFFFVFQGICEHFWAFEQEQMTILNNEEKASPRPLGGPRNNCLTKCEAYLSPSYGLFCAVEDLSLPFGLASAFLSSFCSAFQSPAENILGLLC